MIRKIPEARCRPIPTPVGDFLLIEAADGSLHGHWEALGECESNGPVRMDRSLQPELSVLLSRYFAGDDVDFREVPTPKGPVFFRACWEATRKIRRGRVWTYAELAERAGSPAALRAAGQAMRRNTLPVIVPCHRVVGSSGSLGGYGGTMDREGPELEIKRWLLALEGAPVTSRCR